MISENGDVFDIVEAPGRRARESAQPRPDLARGAFPTKGARDRICAAKFNLANGGVGEPVRSRRPGSLSRMPRYKPVLPSRSRESPSARRFHQRPSGRAAQYHEELAPLHSITSSARASSEGGISRPIAFAALRLMTSSNLVGCSTGISAGFAPLRTRSTISAPRRHWPP